MPSGQAEEGSSEGDKPATEPAKAPAKRGAMMAAKREGKGKDAKIVLANGDKAPDHIKPSMVPPNWTNTKISLDPDADVLVQGRDAAGRSKTVYSDKFHMRNAANKFARTREMLLKRNQIAEQNQENRKDPSKKEEADCAWLMIEQATRPGSDKDTKSKVQAYGATTLLGKHVIVSGEEVRLKFVGKEGINHDHVVNDPALAEMLKDRKKAAGDDGKLFNTDYEKVHAYSKTLDGGRFTPKDFRTNRANEIAISEIAKIENPPKTMKDYKALVKSVAVKVASVLGNRPQQALESYIDPTVFSHWRLANA